MRAPRRMRTPHEPRGRRDLSAARRAALALKEAGAAAQASWPAPAGGAASVPRVRVRRPGEGFRHPAGRTDVLRVLRFFGEPYTYGVRSIDLARRPAGVGAGQLLLGRLMVPGRIMIYEQPPSPWHVQGTLPRSELARLSRAGALVDASAGGGASVVSWPADTLRDFMLFDVLMHELAHHLVQHEKGKRRVRVARTSDHEAFAERFAARCRELYRDAGDGAGGA